MIFHLTGGTLMGRSPRIQYEGALYHVFPRGNRRERIVHTGQDYRILERYLIEAALKTGVLLRAWYPMPNHLHAMAETPWANISEFMHHWQSRYARYYNRAHAKVGHLFQGRYGSRLVQRDAYQKELIRYIHLNAHRAKNSQVINGWGRRYSSHRFYIGETCSPEVWAWIEPMLKLFGDDLVTARQRYVHFLADGLRKGDWQDFYTPTNGILGDEAFVKAEDARQRAVRKTTDIPPWRRDTFMQELIDATVSVFGVKADELASPSQRPDLCRARRAAAYVGRRWGLTATALGRAWRRDHSAISQMVRVVEETRDPDVDSLMAVLQLSRFHTRHH